VAGRLLNRPYIGNGYFHPATWRRRLDFGTGTFGDMGCHILDPVFKAIGLHAPISVRSEGPAPNQWNWAMDSRIHYIFPGNERTAEKTLPVTWYDGASKPPAEVLNLLEGDARPDSGSIFIGTRECWCCRIGRGRCFIRTPNSRISNFPRSPEPTIGTVPSGVFGKLQDHGQLWLRRAAH